MGIHGKVLAILNILAAIGFVSLAALDYGKRQSWSYAVLQEHLLMQGLPVDENEKDEEGQRLVRYIGPRMQQQLFTAVPGRTQKEVLEKRQADLRQAIESQATAAAKKQQFTAILVPLARSESEREGLRRLIQSKTDAELFDGPFKRAFAGAVAGTTSPPLVLLEGQNEADFKSQPLEPDQWRQAIAHVLVNTSRSSEEHQQALLAVGITSYVHELDTQAAALGAMVPVLQKAQADERAQFEIRHKALLQEIMTAAGRIADLDETLAQKKSLLDKHKGLIAAREQEVQDLHKRIEAAREATKRALALQGELESELHAAHQAITTTDQQNQRLEREIKTQELGR